MKQILMFALVLAVLLILSVLGCKDQATVPGSDPGRLTKEAIARLVQNAFADSSDEDHGGLRFRTRMRGENEVPPHVTRARGKAMFKLSSDSTKIFYRVSVRHIQNVVGSHIHLAPDSVNGPVIFPIYSAAPGGGPFHGVLAEGWFTPHDLVGPLAGSTDFVRFLNALRSDSLYVNVHTDDGIAPPNTGTGDFPGGEIRGQLHVHGHGEDHEGDDRGDEAGGDDRDD